MFHINRRFRDRLRHVSYQPKFQRPSPSRFISTDVSETVSVTFHINRRFRYRLHHVSYQPTFQRPSPSCFNQPTFQIPSPSCFNQPTFQIPSPSCFTSTDVSDTVSVTFHINRRFRDSHRLHHQVPDINDFRFFRRRVFR